MIFTKIVDLIDKSIGYSNFLLTICAVLVFGIFVVSKRNMDSYIELSKQPKQQGEISSTSTERKEIPVKVIEKIQEPTPSVN